MTRKIYVIFLILAMMVTGAMSEEYRREHAAQTPVEVCEAGRW